MYIYVFSYVDIHTSAAESIAYIYIYKHICIHRSIHIYVYVYIYIYVYICMYIYTYIYVCICICTQAHTQTHTHIHAHIHVLFFIQVCVNIICKDVYRCMCTSLRLWVSVISEQQGNGGAGYGWVKRTRDGGGEVHCRLRVCLYKPNPELTKECHAIRIFILSTFFLAPLPGSAATFSSFAVDLFWATTARCILVLKTNGSRP